jgi:hypothetical protein
MAAPAHVFTIARAAQIIRKDEQLLWDLAINMEPEDGCLWVHGTDEQHTMAFTDRGLEYLQELVAEHKAATRLRSPDQISCGHSDSRIDALMK